MKNSSFRPLTDYEAAILGRLLETDFPARDAIAEQVNHSLVKQLYEDGSLEFRVDTSLEANPNGRIPTEAEAEDIDGVTIHFLLHVVNGKVDELEIYKEDHSPLKRLPPPEELRVFSPG